MGTQPNTVKPVLSGHSKKRRPKLVFKTDNRLMHSAIPFTFIKLPFAIKIFVLSLFEWPHKTCLTVTVLLIKMGKKNCVIEELNCMATFKFSVQWCGKNSSEWECK